MGDKGPCLTEVTDTPNAKRNRRGWTSSAVLTGNSSDLLQPGAH